MLYHAVCLLLGIAFGVLMPQAIRITAVSLVPVAMILLTVLQILLFKDSQSEEGFSTAYGADIHAREQNTWTRYVRSSLVLSLPWQLWFAVFFSNPVKFLSCLLYVAFFVAGSLVFRAKHGTEIKRRHRAERDELEAQQKREELGKWK